MPLNTERKVIRVHRQAMGMLSIVRRHLEKFPQDGVLLIIDFERTLRDLGFDLTSGMRKHLLARLYPPVPDGGELYEAVKEGHVKLPAQVRLNLGPSPSAGELTGVNPDGPGVPISRMDPLGPPEHLARPVAAFAPVSAKPGTAGYSVLIQLDDDIINRVISTAYDARLIPHQWNGTYQTGWPALNVQIVATYSADVAKPTIDFKTNVVNGVALNLKVHVKLILTFNYQPLGSLPGFSDTLPVEVDISARAIGTAELKNTTATRAAVYLNLITLQNLQVTLAGTTLPPAVEDLVSAVIQRIAQTELGRVVLPLSFDFEQIQRAGVPITVVASRIRAPSGVNPGSLTIAIDTTGAGDPTSIPNIIPATDHFGFIATRTFLIDQAWPIIASQEFPTEQQGVKIHDPVLDLRDNFIYFFVKATKEIDCLPDVNADVTVKMVFESFQESGVFRTRLKSLGDPDISIDFWDRLFYTVLFGLILGAVGGVGIGIIGMIAFNVVIAVLEGKGETAIGNAIQKSSVGFKDKIPGTNIVVEASTPIAPTVYSDMIFGYGDAVFYVEP